mmetsp:Transcript_2101/g.8202  ORF Transcript_2101/g.8202 Transcript_2101/m.8202 type:complete len:287 (-) Transcript_2101:192-1052(-)
MSRLALAAAAACCLVSGSFATVAHPRHVAEPSADFALAANTRGRYRTHADRNFVRGMGFKHRLRVCNAYPSDASFNVYVGRSKISEAPLPYKGCEEFAPPMKAGDKLEFQLGGVSAGSFAVSDLPNNDAVLVLIIYRHDPMSTAVAFESHVFANLINAQIAVLDTFKGSAKSSLKIQDASSAKTSRSEELRFDSVVAVNPGIYEVVAEDPDGKMVARQELVALNRESYVVIRTGVQAEKGHSYKQELLVFPRSDPKVLTGAASTLRGTSAVVFASLLSLITFLVSP